MARTPFAWFIAQAVSTDDESDVLYLLDWYGPGHLGHHPAGMVLRSFTINPPGNH